MNNSINPYITAFKDIAQCRPETTLGSALSMINSSHEPVFVLDKNNKFLGLVSPYYTLFRKRYPYTTKVKSLIIVPPRINNSTHFYEIADFMISTRIYILPVMNEKEEIKGKVTARNIIKAAINQQELIKEIAESIKIEKAITARTDTKAKDIYSLLRQKATSRIILVNDKGKLAGIIARRDIEEAFTKPTTKQRFSTRKGKPINYSFDKEITTRFDSPISKFYIRNVLTAKKELGIEKVLQGMMRAGKNSIVIVDKNNYPSGIISIRTILKALAKLKPKREIPIIFRKPTKESTNYEMGKIYALLERLGKKLDKMSPVQQIKINFKKSKKPAGGIILFDITLQVEFFSGQNFIAEVKERKVEMGVREAIKRIEKQQRRS
ncbi:CBS domain-containing protein [Candidatus Parcubacteria bacterium]|nr:CBS domain-containing protein [Candidatus Parcubacteria bacterium]